MTRHDNLHGPPAQPPRLKAKVRRELHGRSISEAATDLSKLLVTRGWRGIAERSGISVQRHRPPAPVPVLPGGGPVLDSRVGSYPWNVAFDPYFDLTPEELEANAAVVGRFDERPQEVSSATWFLPRFEHALFGGVYTILRLMSWMREHHAVEHRLVLFDGLEATDSAIRGMVQDAFANLADIDIVLPHRTGLHLDELPPTDIAVCSLWSSAYALARYNATTAKFYMVQDFEPSFYPAGTPFALAEATYRLGFAGLVNTPGLAEVYAAYGNPTASFVPAVDFAVPDVPKPSADGGPIQIVLYGRPSTDRNAFELIAAACHQIKYSIRGQGPYHLGRGGFRPCLVPARRRHRECRTAPRPGFRAGSLLTIRHRDLLHALEAPVVPAIRVPRRPHGPGVQRQRRDPLDAPGRRKLPRHPAVPELHGRGCQPASRRPGIEAEDRICGPRGRCEHYMAVGVRTDLAVHHEPTVREGSMTEPGGEFASIDFDRTSRHRLIADVVNDLLPAGSTILDLGGSEGLTAHFLPDHFVVALDLRVSPRNPPCGHRRRTFPSPPGRSTQWRGSIFLSTFPRRRGLRCCPRPPVWHGNSSSSPGRTRIPVSPRPRSRPSSSSSSSSTHRIRGWRSTPTTGDRTSIRATSALRSEGLTTSWFGSNPIRLWSRLQQANFVAARTGAQAVHGEGNRVLFEHLLASADMIGPSYRRFLVGTRSGRIPNRRPVPADDETGVIEAWERRLELHLARVVRAGMAEILRYADDLERGWKDTVTQVVRLENRLATAVREAADSDARTAGGHRTDRGSHPGLGRGGPPGRHGAAHPLRLRASPVPQHERLARGAAGTADDRRAPLRGTRSRALPLAGAQRTTLPRSLRRGRSSPS